MAPTSTGAPPSLPSPSSSNFPIAPVEQWEPPAPIRTTYDDSDSEGEEAYVKGDAKRKQSHRPRPSTSRLLPEPQSPFEDGNQDRLDGGSNRGRTEQMEMEEETTGDSRVWRGMGKFVKRNQGTDDGLLEFRRVVGLNGGC